MSKPNSKMRKAIAEGSKCKRKCTACNGSGHYDTKGSPKCGSCKGTGLEPTTELYL